MTAQTLRRTALRVMILAFGIGWMMGCKSAPEPQPLTPCEEWRQDVNRVRFHQGYRNHPPDQIYCPGEEIKL